MKYRTIKKYYASKYGTYYRNTKQRNDGTGWEDISSGPMKYNKVKDCPFCGKQPRIFNDSGNDGKCYDTVLCTTEDCPASLQGEVFVYKWNDRK